MAHNIQNFRPLKSHMTTSCGASHNIVTLQSYELKLEQKEHLLVRENDYKNYDKNVNKK